MATRKSNSGKSISIESVLAEQREADRRGGATLRERLLNDQAEAARKSIAKIERDRRQDSIDSLEPALAKLASVRDLLRKMESGDDGGFMTETCATFARATLCEAAAELEQALSDLKLIEIDRQIGGCFVPDGQEGHHG